jgi:hypothetical protein
MMFLIIFNMAVYVVDNLHIYNMSGYKGDPQYNPIGNTEDSSSFYYKMVQAIFVGALAGIATATIYTLLTKSYSDAGVAYSVMSGVFWGTATGAFSVIQEIGGNNLGSSMIVMIFSVALIFVWGAGLLQMVRGGWKTYE